MSRLKWFQKKSSLNKENNCLPKDRFSFSFKKTSLLLIVAVLISSSLGGLLNTKTVQAASMAEGMSLEQQVQSYIYYRSLGTCLVDGGPNLKDGGWFDGGERITRSHAQSGQWFGQGMARGASYLDGVNGIKAKDDGSGVDCNQTSLVNNALKLWGDWPADEALCAMGMRSASDDEFNAKRCTNAQGGSDEFKRGNSEDLLKKFKDAVKKRVYDGKEPTVTANGAWTDAGKYLLYLTTLQKACVPSANISTSKPSGATDKDYAVREVDKDKVEGKVVEKTVYYTSVKNLAKSDTVVISVGNSLDTTTGLDTMSCGNLLKAINGDNDKNNGLADKYKAWLTNAGAGVIIPTLPGEGTTCATDGACPPAGESSCSIEQVGWLVCPAVSFLADIADSSFSYLSDSFLSIDIGILTDNGTYQAWTAMRNIANVAFVIAFLFIIFSQLTGQGIANYGIKKMLPRLVVAAILVNVSFFVCQIAVDLSNILGYSLNNVFKSVGGGIATTNGGAVPGDESGNWAGIVILVIGAGAGAWALGVSVLIPFLLGAVLALLMVFLILILRQMLIILLIVIAPLAFVAFLLPNTEQWFTKWRKMFVTLLLVFPIIGLLFGAATLASSILVKATYAGVADGGPEGIIGKVVAAGIVALPLFLIWPILKSALDGAGNIGQTMNKLGDRFSKGGRSRAANSGVMKSLAHRRETKRAQIGAGIYEGRNPLSKARSRVNAGLNTNKAFNAATGNYGTIRGANIEKIENEETKLAEAAVQLQARAGTSLEDQFKDAIKNNDIVRAKAAQNLLMKSGSKGVGNVRDVIEKQEASLTKEMRTGLASNIAENHGQVAKQKAPDLLKWSTNPFVKNDAGENVKANMEQISKAKETWGGLSARELADLPDGSFTSAMRSGGVSATTREALQTDRLREVLSDAQRTALSDDYVAPTVAAPIAPVTPVAPATQREFSRQQIEAMGAENVTAAINSRGGVGALNDGDIVSIINAHGGTPIATDARREAIRRNLITDTPPRDPNTMPKP